MTKPSDRAPDDGKADEKERVKILKSSVSQTGFKEVDPGAGPHAKHHHAKHFANPQDKKNFIFLLLAVIVILVILALLELKQLHDATMERALQEHTQVQSK
jgi:hypothetical protein